MEAKYRRALRELDRQIKEAQTAENFEDEVEARGRKVAVLTVAQAWAAAAVELDLMAQLVADQGQTSNEAQARYAQARALCHLPERYAEAEERFAQALALYDEAGDRETPVTLLQNLAGLHLVRGDEAALAQALDDAFARLPTAVSDPMPHINFYRFRAGCHALSLEFQATLADLEQALALAKQVEDDELLTAVSQQQEAATHLAQGHWSPELSTFIWPHLPGQPTPSLLADEDLIKALELMQNGRFRPAFRLAQKALDNARQARDLYRYIRYLLASIILAQLHDRRNERVEVLTVLLRCKVYLEIGLGTAVQPYMDQFLDTITERWGEDGRRAAIRAYREHVAQIGPIQL
jgi:tetratricopeptide (TPR) repeat protein